MVWDAFAEGGVMEFKGSQACHVSKYDMVRTPSNFPWKRVGTSINVASDRQ